MEIWGSFQGLDAVNRGKVVLVERQELQINHFGKECLLSRQVCQAIRAKVQFPNVFELVHVFVDVSAFDLVSGQVQNLHVHAP